MSISTPHTAPSTEPYSPGGLLRFETQDGVCFALSDRIVIGELREGRVTAAALERLVWSALAHAVFALGMLLLSGLSAMRGRWWVSLFALTFSLYFVLSITLSLMQSQQNSIPRDRIERIHIRSGIPWLLQPRVVIVFRDRRGKRRRRVLLLERYSADGQQPIEHARWALSDQRYPV